MTRRIWCVLPCLNAVPLLGVVATVSADVIVPGEVYTPDLIGPWVVDSYEQRQAQGGSTSIPPGSEQLEIPLATSPKTPWGALIPQVAGELTGSPPRLGLNFAGAFIEDSGIGVPDTMGAVGPNHFMEVINGNVSVFRKSDGVRIASESLNSFFSGVLTGGGLIGDPRVLFDQHSGRWIVIATNFGRGTNPGRIAVAVSLSDDPRGLFFKTDFLAAADADASAYPDYPTLGVDVNGIYIGALAYRYPEDGATMTIWSIDKAPMVENPPSVGTINVWRSLELSWGNQPAHTYGTPGSEYIIGKSTQSALRIYRVDPPLTAPTMTTWTIPVTSFGEPPTAPALGSTVPIDTVGDRLMMSVYRNGSLWTTQTINVDDRAAIRWYEVNPTSRTVIQWGNVADSSLHFYDPSLMVNSAGHVAMGFSGSDANQYIGCYYTGRRATDALGDMAVPQLLKAGEARHQNPAGNGTYDRWGDYSYTTLDPVDQSTFWTIQEFARTSISYPNGSAWGTWVGVLGFVPCALASDCNDANECTIDSCVNGLCENNPPANETPCNSGLCCYGVCTVSTCSSDADCDDGDECSTDTCLNICHGAHCTHVWPPCIDENPDGCCGPACTSDNDFDCHCGNGLCSQGENPCNCLEDCGAASAQELAGSTCHDGVDNDCDGYADCDDVLDCASDPGCGTCNDNSGNSPLVCVNWSSPIRPVQGSDFTVETADPNSPNNPGVTFLTGNEGWRVWSQVSGMNNTPANLGHLRVDPTLFTANFSVALAHGTSPGAANVASMALVKTGWTGQSNLSAGSISGDLGGDLVLQKSGGQGGVASFTIGGSISGDVTVPTVDSLQVNGSVSSGSVITLVEFAGNMGAEFSKNGNGETFAGDLVLPNGLPSDAVVIIDGLFTNTASLSSNQQHELAGSVSFYGGTAGQSVIDIGALTGSVNLTSINLSTSVYSGTMNLNTVGPTGFITIEGANLDGHINVVGDWEGALLLFAHSVSPASLVHSVFSPASLISIGGNLANTSLLSFASKLEIAGDIIVGGDIEGVVEVYGEFNGNICGANLQGWPNLVPPALPPNINITKFGTHASICGTSVCAGMVPGTDCNHNGFIDGCDIISGTSTDCNLNGIPDDCEGDCNGNLIPDVCEGIVYVDQHAPGPLHNGATWASAYLTLDEALAKAVCTSGKTHEILIAGATYVSQSQTTFSIGGLDVLGGYVGNGSANCTGDPNVRDPKNCETILDGQNSHRVVLLNSGVLDGVTVTHGNTTGNGGGVLLNGGTIKNCKVAFNKAEAIGAWGGGIAINIPQATVCNCVVNDNIAGDFGGGIGSSAETTSIRNCTILANSAGNRGGGIGTTASSVSLDIRNSVLWLNSAAQQPEVGISGATSASVSNSDVQGGWTVPATNISQYPQFVNLTGRNLRLLGSSPCVDSGDNSALGTPPLVTMDFDGNQRFVDARCDGTATVDMGAFEYQTINPGNHVTVQNDGGADRNRYLSFSVTVTSQGNSAIRVMLTSLHHPSPPNLPQFPAPNFTAFECGTDQHQCVRYVGTPTDCTEFESPPTTFKCARLQCAPAFLDWTAVLGGATIHVSDRAIIPSSTYSIDLIPESCAGNLAACPASCQTIANTARWGDVSTPFQVTTPGAALTQPNIADVGAAVDKFKSLPGAIRVARGDVNPYIPDGTVSIADVANVVDAFKGMAYPFTGSQGPLACP